MRLRLLAALFAFAGSVTGSLFACGGSPSNPVDAGHPSDGGSTDGEASDAPSADASEGGACARPSVSLLPFAEDLGADVAAIDLMNRTQAGSHWSFGAYFYQSLNCTGEVVDGCRVCTAIAQTAHEPKRHVGEIAATTSLETITLAPGTDGGYMWLSGSGPTLFAAGERVNVTGAGGFYPAFDVTFEAPALDRISAIGAPISGELELPAMQPLRVEWSGTPVTDELVAVRVADLSPDYTSITCVFAAETATCGEIPNAVLSRLPRRSGSVRTESLTRTEVTSGAGTISVVATTEHASFGVLLH